MMDILKWRINTIRMSIEKTNDGTLGVPMKAPLMK
jgi:hypothetical protein